MTNAEIFARLLEIPDGVFKQIVSNCTDVIREDCKTTICALRSIEFERNGFAIQIYSDGDIYANNVTVSIPALIDGMKAALEAIDKAKTEHNPEN